MDALLTPHYAAAALVTIDIQVDTLDGQPLEIPGTSGVVPNVAILCQAFREARRPIVHIVRLYRSDGSNAEPLRRTLVSGPTPMLRPGTPGRLLATGIAPDAAADLDDQLLLSGGTQTLGLTEVVMYKPRWGAFFKTSLNEHLRAASVDTVVFAGCNFPNCPRTSIYEASATTGSSSPPTRCPGSMTGAEAKCRTSAWLWCRPLLWSQNSGCLPAP